MILNNVSLPKMDGMEVSPGVILLGEPSPIAGTNTMTCLANVSGMLCLVKLRITFGDVAGQTDIAVQPEVLDAY